MVFWRSVESTGVVILVVPSDLYGEIGVLLDRFFGVGSVDSKGDIWPGFIDFIKNCEVFKGEVRGLFIGCDGIGELCGGDQVGGGLVGLGYEDEASVMIGGVFKDFDRAILLKNGQDRAAFCESNGNRLDVSAQGAALV